MHKKVHSNILYKKVRKTAYMTTKGNSTPYKEHYAVIENVFEEF